MDFLSVCSGFGGAELAWGPLGWICRGVAEIDPAARAVLKHRWPDVKNYGDFTKIGVDDGGSVDVVVGGTPCQSFSVAGLRGGLGDERGNLALEFLRLVDRKRPRWVVWENVPGVLSSTSHIAPDPRPPAIDLESGDGPGDGEEIVVEDEYDANEDHAFACFLAGLSELGYQYAYRTLDAQHFGVPQRRRRVFVVGYLGDWRRAAAVLFERHCLSGHPPPGREARQVAPTIPARSLGGGGLGTDFDCDGGAIAEGWGGNNTSGPIEVATACNAHGGPAGRLDFESETFITQTVATLDASCGKLQGCSGQDMLHQHSHLIPQISNPLSAKPYGDRGDGDLEKLIPETAHSLRADGFDASEDGPGRGTPLVPVAAHMTGAGFWQEGFGTLRAREQDSHENLVAFRAAGQDGFTPSEISPPIAGTDGGGAGVPTIAFSCKDSGLDCGDLSPTLRSMGHDSSHANAGGQVAVAFNLRGREGGSMAEMAEMAEMASVRVASGGSSRSYVGQAIGWSEELTAHEDCAGTIQRGGADGRHEGVMTPQMAVRRLTVEECEKLQGIPPGHTQVPYRGKPMADGPRYKMIGNGFAIPVVNWIGQRIQMIEDQETPCSP